MGNIIDLDKFYTDVGENIKNYRSKLGYSQDDLAKYLDLTRTSIVNIEKGRQRPPLHAICEIASFLKISIEDLIPAKDEKEQIDFLKSVKENIDLIKSKYKEVSIDKEKISHFFQISASK